ncbi:MAG: phosphate acyltransferase PlsX [Candidatus Dormibacteraeota bacterium]|nr:phosphate acyltransferase PlsX [Candidatus Dormibacteraeota bacterium]MBO0745276.1 phosphate acyltransferase PlsX [Candidatus Dormibacteraeota bacterium]
MRIAVDGMGGDHAPDEIVKGAALAADELDVDVTVVGQPARVQALLEPYAKLHLHPATQVVEMDEHPARAVRSKPDSSMSVCARLCKEGRMDGWVSAGNSGGVLAAAVFIQGRVPGVERPALGTVLPGPNGPSYLLDVGANVDCRPEYLVQFAAMGARFAAEVMGRRPPRVGLLANGEEPSKGNQLVRDVHERLRADAPGFEFVGNLEPKDVLQGHADVVVADGFAGNLMVKAAEATVDMLLSTLREEIPRTGRGKLGGLLIRPAIGRIRGTIDWREYGGAPLLGIDGTAIVAHGRSDARAIRSAIKVARDTARAALNDKIREALTV